MKLPKLRLRSVGSKTRADLKSIGQPKAGQPGLCLTSQLCLQLLLVADTGLQFGLREPKKFELSNSNDFASVSCHLPKN